jgi:DNA topoisomerase II
MGGKDAASPRYVFTKLEAITRYIFHPDDDALLEYLDEDGQSIEPVHYVPTIPMILVNGSEGIGTGWSSSIPTYNPREIIANLKLMIQGDECLEMLPWYRGFTGVVQAKTPTTCIISGTLEQVDDQTVVISELPVGKWTTDYKQYLESVLIGNATGANKDKEKEKEKDKDEANAPPTGGPFVKDFKENHTDTTVLFTVNCPPDKITNLDQNALMKKFKLDTTVSTTNMHLFDLNNQIRKFEG